MNKRVVINVMTKIIMEILDVLLLRDVPLMVWKSYVMNVKKDIFNYLKELTAQNIQIFLLNLVHLVIDLLMDVINVIMMKKMII